MHPALYAIGSGELHSIRIASASRIEFPRPHWQVKILDHLQAYSHELPVGEQLRGKAAVIFNRSEVVGRPLAAMLANDGATVYSIDISGMLVYSKGRVPGTVKVEEPLDMDTSTALAAADIVISGVPSPSFQVP